jgi:undecaprenyl-diphosphatase
LLSIKSAGAMMTLEWIEDIAKLAFSVAGLYFALTLYVRHRHPSWADPLAKRRLTVLLLLVFATSAIKLIEDVLGGEAGPIDAAILVFIRAGAPGGLTGFFEAVTLTGSARALFPLAAVATIALLGARRRVDALLLSASVGIAAGLVYVIKTAVGRERPALWETQWYWGSSFPSGHTLVVAAFATAGALCIGRMWPAARLPSLGMALA